MNELINIMMKFLIFIILGLVSLICCPCRYFWRVFWFCVFCCLWPVAVLIEFLLPNQRISAFIERFTLFQKIHTTTLPILASIKKSPDNLYRQIKMYLGQLAPPLRDQLNWICSYWNTVRQRKNIVKKIRESRQSKKREVYERLRNCRNSTRLAAADIDDFLLEICLCEYEVTSAVAENQRQRLSREMTAEPNIGYEEIFDAETQLILIEDDLTASSRTKINSATTIRLKRLQKYADADSLKTLFDYETSYWEGLHPLFADDLVKEYVCVCVQIAWRIAIHDPAMFVTADDLVGWAFDKARHQCLGVVGDVICKVIWPALYLRNGGPLIRMPIVMLDARRKGPLRWIIFQSDQFLRSLYKIFCSPLFWFKLVDWCFSRGVQQPDQIQVMHVERMFVHDLYGQSRTIAFDLLNSGETPEELLKLLREKRQMMSPDLYAAVRNFGRAEVEPTAAFSGRVPPQKFSKSWENELTYNDIVDILLEIYLYEFEAAKIIAKRQILSVCQRVPHGEGRLQDAMRDDLYELKILMTIRKADTVRCAAIDDVPKPHESDIQTVKRFQKNMLTKWLKVLLDADRDVRYKSISIMGEVKYWISLNPQFARPALSEYICACVEVAWRMAVQEPPMLVSVKDLVGGVFDKNKHVQQSGSGNFISRVVWPGLYLYKGGPLVKRPIVILGVNRMKCGQWAPRLDSEEVSDENCEASLSAKTEDISSVHRSINVADRFEYELYGERWTDAYEELTNPSITNFRGNSTEAGQTEGGEPVKQGVQHKSYEDINSKNQTDQRSIDKTPQETIIDIDDTNTADGYDRVSFAKSYNVRKGGEVVNGSTTAAVPVTIAANIIETFAGNGEGSTENARHTVPVSVQVTSAYDNEISPDTGSDFTAGERKVAPIGNEVSAVSSIDKNLTKGEELVTPSNSNNTFTNNGEDSSTNVQRAIAYLTMDAEQVTLPNANETSADTGDSTAIVGEMPAIPTNEIKTSEDAYTNSNLTEESVILPINVEPSVVTDNELTIDEKHVITQDSNEIIQIPPATDSELIKVQQEVMQLDNMKISTNTKKNLPSNEDQANPEDNIETPPVTSIDLNATLADNDSTKIVTGLATSSNDISTDTGEVSNIVKDEVVPSSKDDGNRANSHSPIDE